MKYLVVLLVAALLIASAFAANDQLKAAIQDHTTQIFGSAMPTAVNSNNFVDFAALALGQSPFSEDSPVPITNAMKRAQASVTVITMDPLPTLSTPITILETNKSQTQAGALVQAVSGSNRCLMGSRSLMSAIYTSNANSMVFSFASQPEFATSFCGSLPTTGPATTVGKSICATLDEFVGSTDEQFSSPESNSAIAGVVALSQQLDTTLLQSQNPGVVVTDDAITINGVAYDRKNQAVALIVKELTYITNVAGSLSSFGTITTDSAVDSFTFVISSAESVQNHAQLIGLIEAVTKKVVEQFATAFSNNLISQVITAPFQLDSSTLCVTGSFLGDAAENLPAQSVVTTEQVRSYQITLWLSLALIATALVGFISTATMHLYPDPAIQGGQSTYWVHKK